MNVDVQFSVKLKSGAKIETTSAQDAKIKQAISEIVFSAEDQPVRNKRTSRAHSFKRWSVEEDSLILDFINKYPPHSAGRRQAIKRLAGEMGRTPQSVITRADGFRAQMKKNEELPANPEGML